MTHKFFSLGATTTAIALAAAFVTAQGPTGQAQAGGPPAVQGANGPRQGLGPQPGRGGRQMAMQGRGQGVGPQVPGRGRGGPFAALDLTQDQRTTISDVQRASRDHAAPLEDELEFTRKTLHRELFADTRDDAKVASLTAKIATLEQQLADLRVKQATTVADLLTPEQRKTIRLADGRRGRPGRGRVGFNGRVPSDASGGTETAGR